MVKKIEEVGNYHIIHLKKGDYFYKIISDKHINNNCNKIVPNQSYSLNLKSIWYQELKFANGKVLNASLNVHCKSFDKDTYICLEEDPLYIQDIFIIENLKGLCLIE